MSSDDEGDDVSGNNLKNSIVPSCSRKTCHLLFLLFVLFLVLRYFRKKVVLLKIECAFQKVFVKKREK
jgi:hypothetical protein